MAQTYDGMMEVLLDDDEILLLRSLEFPLFFVRTLPSVEEEAAAALLEDTCVGRGILQKGKRNVWFSSQEQNDPSRFY